MATLNEIEQIRIAYETFVQANEHEMIMEDAYAANPCPATERDYRVAAGSADIAMDEYRRLSGGKVA